MQYTKEKKHSVYVWADMLRTFDRASKIESSNSVKSETSHSDWWPISSRKIGCMSPPSTI